MQHVICHKILISNHVLIKTKVWRRRVYVPFHVHEQETSMQSVNILEGVYLMIMPTCKSKYALALQSTATILFSLYETSNKFINNAMCFSKIHFYHSGQLLGISSVGNRYHDMGFQTFNNHV